MNYGSKELYDTYEKTINLISEYDKNLKLGRVNENFSHMACSILKDLYSASYKTGMMEVWMEIEKIQSLLKDDDKHMDEKILLDCLVKCKNYIEKNLMKRLKVYICSRNMDEFKDVIRSLELEGFDVIARENDENTLDRIYTLLPEIIVIDNDSNNNGLTLFNEIREGGPIASIPVVFTGYNNVETKIEALLLGALDYIEKPFMTLELFIKLKNFMEIGKKLSRNTVYDIKTGIYSRKHGKRGEVYIHSSSLEGSMKKNMLIIDEDPIILSILSSRYTNKGYSVLTSQNGLEALEILDEKDIDIVITDLIVPGITGNEIIRRIKDKKYSVRILILSSQRGESHIDLALKSGADEYLVKPFSPVELDLRIQRLIG